ncbi:MAG TPA: TIGR00730 family Rossman fold protein [Verrucomicrobiales bacterium]|nr:TIGR00730 family Rossman fold protein [Verrucomicrobiales bacterium]
MPISFANAPLVLSAVKSVCVYCGASPGRNPAFLREATELGATLARRGLEVVFGGGRVGLMGAVADAALRGGAPVTGVIPGHLMELEVGHEGVTRLIAVDSMHERKALMTRLSDACVVLPGGFGTLDEMFEILSWNQLEVAEKPCGLLNVCGYFDELLRFLDRMVEERFLLPEHRALLLVDDDRSRLLDALEAYTPVRVPGWVTRKIHADPAVWPDAESEAAGERK